MILIIILMTIKITTNIKMSEQTTKYYKFDTSGSGRVTIPIAMAKGLGWKHGDELAISIEVMNGYKGLFLFKTEIIKAFDEDSIEPMDSTASNRSRMEK